MFNGLKRNLKKKTTEDLPVTAAHSSGVSNRVGACTIHRLDSGIVQFYHQKWETWALNFCWFAQGVYGPHCGWGILNMLQMFYDDGVYLAATSCSEESWKLIGSIANHCHSLSFLHDKFPPQKHGVQVNIYTTASQQMKEQFRSKRFMGHTRYSSVLGISRIDLTPAHTTVTAVRPSSVKSEDTSMAAKSRTQTTSHFNKNSLNHMML